MSGFQIDIPKEPKRIWDLEVPVAVDKENKTVKIYLSGTIEDPCLYNEACFTIDTADKDTTIELLINTPGGIIDSALMLINSIKNTPARVVGHLTGTVASAGTILALSCDELIISDHLSFMIHNYSGGMAGKGHEMKARQKFTDKHLNEAFKSFYAGFLTDEEMESVIDGSDMWMGTEEVQERWNNRVVKLAGD